MSVHLVPDLGSRRAALLPRLHGRAWTIGPERTWVDAVTSWRRARRALELFGPSPHVLDTEDQLAELVVTADADALADLRAHVLAPLGNVKPDVADRLAETLRSWLLHQGRRDAVAADLVVHPQTVRYRMTQIRELFGDQLLDPATVAQLVIALSTQKPTSRSQPRSRPQRRSP
jgi:DNA-binding PucR family transcriptional regulator